MVARRTVALRQGHTLVHYRRLTADDEHRALAAPNSVEQPIERVALTHVPALATSAPRDHPKQ